MAKPRILLADDHELLLDALRKLLEPEFEVVGAVQDGCAAVEAYKLLRPDVLLLDIIMPGLNGIEVAREVRRAFPDARVLFMTMLFQRAYVEEAFRVGASGFLVKNAAAVELMEAIRTVLRGGRFVSRQVTATLGAFAGFERGVEAAPHFGGKLTPRQRQTLQLIAEGKSMKEIAHTLDISVRTVEFHKTALTQQLGLRTIAELTRYAVSQRIVGEMSA